MNWHDWLSPDGALVLLSLVYIVLFILSHLPCLPPSLRAVLATITVDVRLLRRLLVRLIRRVK
jgi:hypothetical protein